MSERQAVTKKLAVEYGRSSKVRKGQILDQVCELNRWHRNHARKALKQALVVKVVKQRPMKQPLYGEPVIAALPDLVPRLCGRSHAKPGSLLKSSIPMRTWAQWDEAVPGFVEIDLVGHEGGNSAGDFCFTLDITDIATGWTETLSVKNKAQKWVFAAIKEATASFPFPILGIDSDNGSEFINWELFRWCQEHQLTFTRSRPGNKNDGAHVEQKNWHIVRQVVGYHRYDTAARRA